MSKRKTPDSKEQRKKRGSDRPAPDRQGLKKSSAPARVKDGTKEPSKGDRSLSRAARLAKHKGIEKSHWEMPASYLLDGSRVASLSEVIDPNVPTKSLDKLSQHELAALVGRRLMTKGRIFSVRMLGVSGVIGKERAIAEIMALSPVGIHLVDVEKRFIRLLIERGLSPS